MNISNKISHLILGCFLFVSLLGFILTPFAREPLTTFYFYFYFLVLPLFFPIYFFILKKKKFIKQLGYSLLIIFLMYIFFESYLALFCNLSGNHAELYGCMAEPIPLGAGAILFGVWTTVATICISVGMAITSFFLQKLKK